MAIWLPRMARAADTGPDLASEVKVLARPQVWTSMLIVVVAAMAYFGVFAYIAPLFLDVAHIAPETLPVVLAVLGVASLGGILIGGRLADWRLMPSVAGIICAEVVVNLALPFLVRGPVTATAGLFVWTIVGVPLIATPLQTRILNGARDAPNLASTLISSAFNVGIASGAALGATALDYGVGFAELPWLALGVLVPGTLLAFAALAQERRARLA
jgi:DHA1 family inner membrane transport protein